MVKRRQHRTRCLGLAFLTLVLLTASTFVSAQADKNTIAAIAATLQAKQYDAALQLLQPALQQYSKDARLWTMRGIAFSGKSSKQEALDAYHHALSILPDYLPALEGAAQIEYETDDKAAAPLLQRILKLRPNDPTSHAMLAVLAYRRGDCQAAVQHFEPSASVLDSRPAALQEYGTCLVKLKQFQKAVVVFQRFVDLPSSDTHSRLQLAEVQLMAEHPKDAISTLQPLLSSKPDAKTLELASTAYEADQDTPHAVATLREAIVLDPLNVDLYIDFANLCYSHQSFQAGISMVTAGLQLQPRSPSLYLARGVLYVQIADYEQAEADFEKANQLDPHQALGGTAQSMAAEQKGDLDKALTTVHAKLSKHPKDAFLLYQQADILVQKGVDAGTPEFQQALESARAAIVLRPDFVPARDILGKLYLIGEQYARVIEQSRLALQYDPKDQTALYHLIVALRKSGQKTELPDLMKRLAQLRQDASKEEAGRNRYKLVEETKP